MQGAKHLIWDQIIIEGDKFQPYLDVIEDLEYAVREARKQVQVVAAKVNKKPSDITESAITFVSSLSDEATNKYGIQNRVIVVSEARKAISKHRMMETIQGKIDVAKHKV